MSIKLDTLNKAHHFCFIEIEIIMAQISHGVFNTVSSIIDVNNSIKFQAMYYINYNDRSVLCFVKLTEKEDYMLSTKCKLTFCHESTADALRYARMGDVGESGNLVNGKSLKQINSDDEWHSLYKLTYVPSATNTHIVKLEFQIPPLQMSFSAIEDDTEFTDFVLHGTDGSVHMHKAVAAAISPYFKALFTGEWSEKSEGIIEVPDTSLVTLQYLKDYMYRGKIPEFGDLKELLLLSSVYMMEDLEKRCVEEMAARINIDSVYDLLKFAMTHNMSQLSFKILEILQNGFVKVEEMKKFYK